MTKVSMSADLGVPAEQVWDMIRGSRQSPGGIAAKAMAFKEAMEPGFKTYQQQVKKNAALMAHCLAERGYKIVSGGTDCHMFLVDLIEKDLTGKEADAALGQANITVNKNTVPNDPRSPFVTSGLRIGTPAATTRRRALTGGPGPAGARGCHWRCSSSWHLCYPSRTPGSPRRPGRTSTSPSGTA